MTHIMTSVTYWVEVTAPERGTPRPTREDLAAWLPGRIPPGFTGEVRVVFDRDLDRWRIYLRVSS